MRNSIIRLVALGQLPTEDKVEAAQLQAFETVLKEILPPVSDEEAAALLSVLPCDESTCFGLAWSILHLIETAPNWPIPKAATMQSNPWVRSILERAS